MSTQELAVQTYYWIYLYSFPFIVTRSARHQNFQFKLSYRITATKFCLKETELCTFCTETKESLFNLFCERAYSKNIGFHLYMFWKIVVLAGSV